MRTEFTLFCKELPLYTDMTERKVHGAQYLFQFLAFTVRCMLNVTIDTYSTRTSTAEKKTEY